MTWQELLEKLQTLSEEELKQKAVIFTKGGLCEIRTNFAPPEATHPEQWLKAIK